MPPPPQKKKNRSRLKIVGVRTMTYGLERVNIPQIEAKCRSAVPTNIFISQTSSAQPTKIFAFCLAVCLLACATHALRTMQHPSG